MDPRTCLISLLACLALLLSLTSATAQTFDGRAVLNSNAAGVESDDAQQVVAADGDGHAIVLWRSRSSFGGTLGTDDDIVFQTSADRGSSWSSAASIASYQTSDSGQDRLPGLTTDYDGVWLAVWASTHELGAASNDLDIFVSRSLNAGQSWSAAAALNTTANTDSEADTRPTIVTDRNGVWIAMWDSLNSLGGTLSTGNDIFAARSVDDGLTWAAPVVINTDATTDIRNDTTPKLATDGSGNWVATWVGQAYAAGPSGTDHEVYSAASSDGGLTWGAPVPLNQPLTDTGFDISPDVATDGAGIWVAVWVTNDDLGAGLGTDRDIAFARSIDNGATWTSPAPLIPDAATDGTFDDANPEIRFDGVATFAVFWSSTNTLSGTIGSEYDILTVRSTDGGVSWSGIAAASSDAPAEETGISSQTATDEAGNWILTSLTGEDFAGTNGNDLDLLYFTGTGPDADGDGLADGAEVKLGTDRLDEDTDNDGVCDGSNQVGACTSAGADNCPFIVNGAQTNSDAAAAGDVCQCGNVDGLLGLDATDIQRAREALIGRTLSGPFDMDFCDMNADAACDLKDITLMAQLAAGSPAPLYIEECTGFGAP